jgi:ATP-dependent Clp protease ATP-binding subunit ClpC
VVDFKNTIIIATSNIGSNLIREKAEQESKAKKKKKKEEIYQETKEELMERLKEELRPEFLNRLDEVIVFHSLDKDQIREIVELELEKTRRLLQGQGIGLKLTKKAKDKIGQEGYDPSFGARPLRRLVQTKIENPISSLILKEDVDKGDIIEVGLKKDKFDFEVKK